MKKTILTAVALLLAIGTGACALGSGSPFNIPSFTLWVESDGQQHPLETEMIYYNSSYICADGIRHFSPLNDWFRTAYKTLPEYPVAGTVICGAEKGEYCLSAETGVPVVYPIQGDTLGEYIPVGDEALPEGSYLLEVPCSVHGTDSGSGRYVGYCIVHVSGSAGGVY